MNSKKKFQENIELLFEDDLFLRGEEIFEQGGVLEMTAIEKNLFSFIVSDKNKFEVEWLRPLSKYQKASCDCNEFRSHKSCPHIVASLLAYKSSLPVEKEIPEKKEVSGSINLSMLLEKVTKEELKSFVKAYAKNDRKLSTALKVHFARKVDVKDNEKKYRSILDAIVKPVTGGDSTIKMNDVRNLNNVAGEFLEQAKDAIALNQFGEAFILIKTTLSKLCYTLHHVPHSLSLLEKNISVCHELMDAITQKNAAYDVLHAAIAFMQEICNYSYYSYLDLRSNCLLILLRLNQLPENVHEIIHNQLRRKREDEAQMVVLCASLVIVQVKLGESITLDAKHLHLLEKTGELLLQNAYFKEIDALCQSYEKVNSKMATIHLKALAVYKPKLLVSKAALYFLHSKDLKLVDWLRQTQNNEVFSQFRAEVSRKANTHKLDPTFFTQYLFRSQQDDALMDWMIEKSDFRLLMTVDEHLFKLFPGKVTDLYENMTEAYLNQHIGQHAYVFIDELLQHLNKIKAGKVANKIALLIEMKFPHRSRMSDLI